MMRREALLLLLVLLAVPVPAAAAQYWDLLATPYLTHDSSTGEARLNYTRQRAVIAMLQGGKPLDSLCCPAGAYCRAGIGQLCEAGRFGSLELNAAPSCEGGCFAGFYCPPGSIMAAPPERACGSAGLICPLPAQGPSRVLGGFYSLAGAGATAAQPACPAVGACTGGRLGDATTRTQQAVCEEGAWCRAGERFLCPPGTWGATVGETRADCSGACPAGTFCAGWGMTQPAPCGSPAVYCPAGSTAPLRVARGFFSDPAQAPHRRTQQLLCPLGSWCSDGLKHECPAGTYGDVEGQHTAACAGRCPPGRWCAKQSITRGASCGGNAFFCPLAAVAPVAVSAGRYSLGGDSATRERQAPCEPGTFCQGGVRRQCAGGSFSSQTGATTCGVCASGHFCPPGSTSPRARACGDAMFSALVAGTGLDAQPSDLASGPAALVCPRGSAWPSGVPAGAVSTTNGSAAGDVWRRDGVEPAPLGSWAIAGRRWPCPPGTWGGQRGLASRGCSGVCPAGSACPIGTSLPVPCTSGSYALASSAACLRCRQGGAGVGTVGEGAVLNGGDPEAAAALAARVLADGSGGGALRCTTARWCCGI